MNTGVFERVAETKSAVQRTWTPAIAVALLALTCAAIAIHGFHCGIEDDAIYLPAIKKMLNPALFPRDSVFFAAQTNAFPLLRMVALSARITHLPVEAVQFLWQFVSVFTLVAGCWSIASQCFSSLRDRFAGVGLVVALMTMPVAGTSLYIADQHLHPRTLACGAVLFAISAALDRRYKLAAGLSLFAIVLHPFMGGFGAAYVLVLSLPLERLTLTRTFAAALPLPFITRPNAAWREAVLTRDYLFLLRWEWYEWLGAIAPLVLLWWFARIAERDGVQPGAYKSPKLAKLCRRLVLYSALMLAAACVVGIPKQLIWLAPLQPMRHLQLVYLLMLLAGGGLVAQFVLGKHAWRWLVLFAPIVAGMAYAQRDLFPTSPHVELAGMSTNNRWVRCFRWIQTNTPTDAYFAVDPNYMDRPGEENFGFRAIAERSKLADNSKDAAVVAVAADLAPEWKQQVDAAREFQHFNRADFLRLSAQFGVDWALVEGDGVPGLECPYQRDHLAVCRIE